MIHYIESRKADPYWNLALEQFIFDELPRDASYFMLWQNHNAIIIGKHQNTQEEINASFVNEKNITVARRLSGGGAVYHDMGNLNFTFITDAMQGMDFSFFCEPVSKALRSMGVPVEIAGRNDMTVEGKKFSGNAQYVKQGRVMHHGTILYDSDLSILSKALNPGDDKIQSRGIKSVQSRVTNIRPYMKNDMSMNDFWLELKKQIAGTGFGGSFFGIADGKVRVSNASVDDNSVGNAHVNDAPVSNTYAGTTMEDLVLDAVQLARVDELREKVYSQWSWNYGKSPPYTLRKSRRIPGCGKIDVFLDIGEEGKIKGISFYGDFFSNTDPAELSQLLTGMQLEQEAVKAALNDVDISRYFRALEKEDFLNLLLA